MRNWSREVSGRYKEGTINGLERPTTKSHGANSPGSLLLWWYEPQIACTKTGGGCPLCNRSSFAATVMSSNNRAAWLSKTFTGGNQCGGVIATVLDAIAGRWNENTIAPPPLGRLLRLRAGTIPL